MPSLPSLQNPNVILTMFQERPYCHKQLSLSPASSFSAGPTPPRSIFSPTSSASSSAASSPRSDLSEIIPSLYISGVRAASDVATLDDAGISSIISIMEPCPWLGPPPGASYDVLAVNVQDSLEDTLLPHFDAMNKFIDDALNKKKTNVLCHCLAGISRSVTCVVAYLMYAHQMPLDDALGLVRGKRPIADPNLSFMRDLQQYEAMLKAGR